MRDGGVTLVEVLVVILIIGILVTIAVPSFLKAHHHDPNRSTTSDGLTITRTVFHGHEYDCVEGEGFSPNLQCWRDGVAGSAKR